MPTDPQIEERMPVWEALSEFFLDTELQPDDHERIARCLAASGYTEKELAGILAHEVYPSCKWNMLSPAGEWAGFSREWIQEKMAPRYDKRPLFHFGLRHRWMYGDHWEKVRTRIAELRSK
ncbi:MAG TPA: hypothetical protein VK178_17840 [Opitutaceae bacterium]|nr:hypothetical protein [Opitutaceae bacterium]